MFKLPLASANLVVASLLLALTLALGSTASSAQNAIPDFHQEPGANPTRSAKVGPDGTESIDPFSGILRLAYEDLMIPGAGGMSIVVHRSYHARQSGYGIVGWPFRGGVSTTGIGWEVHFGRAWGLGNLTINVDNSGSTTEIATSCVIPKVNNEPVTSRNPVFELPNGTRKAFYTAPEGSRFPLVSKDHWGAECIGHARTEGGQSYREVGLRIYAPDGTAYLADRRSRTRAPTALGESTAATHAWYVTKITDARGNRVDYTFKPRASTYHTEYDRIEASDGRIVDFSYKNTGSAAARLETISYGKQRIEYVYSDLPGIGSRHSHLTEVRMPEGMTWAYSYHDSGYGLHSVATVEAPYGGISEYSYQLVDLSAFPQLSPSTIAVATKATSGPDIEPGLWRYRFYRNEAVSDLDLTDIEGPHSIERYHHCSARSIRYTGGLATTGPCLGIEGALIKKEVFAPGALSPIQSTRYQWGISPVSSQWEVSEFRAYTTRNIFARRMLQQTISQDGQDNTTWYGPFDAFDNPANITEYSGPPLAYPQVPTDQKLARQRNLTYHNDTDRWILGQTLTETLREDSLIVDGVERDMAVTTTRTYFPNGLLKSQSVNGRGSESTYYPNGELRTTTDAAGRTSTFSDYHRGIAQREEHPEGVVMTRTVDDYGVVTAETDARGLITSFDYDDLNRVTQVTTPRLDDADTRISYAFRADTAPSRTLTRGRFISREVVDGFGRKVRTFADGIRQENDLDALGRVVRQHDSTTIVQLTSPNFRSFEFDALGRVIKTTHSADNTGRRVDYAAGPDQVRQWDERDDATLYTYRSYGNPGERYLLQIDSPEDVTTVMERHRNGALLRVTQSRADGSEALSRAYIRDEHYQLELMRRPETPEQRMRYDEVGNVVERGPGAASMTRYTYDDLNRLLTVTFPDGSPAITNTYDPAGNIVSTTRGDVRWVHEYDDNSNLSAATATVYGVPYRFEFGYDENDALSALRYPSGHTVTLTPDPKGWPTAALPYITQVEYYPSGHVRRMLAANGVATDYSLDERLRVAAIHAQGADAQSVNDLSYEYDPLGNPERVLDGIDTNNDVTLEYDGLSRLTLAAGPWGEALYDYSVHGDIERRSIAGLETHYDYGTTTPKGTLSALSGREGWTFRYDAYGNMTFNGRDELRYDPTGRLQSVRYQTSGNDRVNYDYDGFGHRARQSGRVDLITFLHDLAGNLMLEVNETTCVQTEHVRLGAMLVAKREFLLGGDSDSDGIPDCVERRNGLDPSESSDASSDLDRDGLTNLEEYQLGSSLTDRDSDGDGIDDAYEVRYGLDLLASDAAVDTDGDGASNLQEFLSGSDPTDAMSLPGTTPGTLRWQHASPGSRATLVGTAPDGSFYIDAGRQIQRLALDGSVISTVDKEDSVAIAVNAGGHIISSMRTSAGGRVFAIDSTGAETWHVDVPSLWLAPSLGADGIAWFQTLERHRDEDALLVQPIDRYGLVGIDLGTGEIVHEAPTTLELGAHLPLLPATAGARADGAFVVHDAEKREVRLRHPSGASRWRTHMHALSVLSNVAVAADGRAFWFDDGAVVSVDAHGAERWRTSVDYHVRRLDTDGLGSLHTLSTGTWSRIDTETGNVLASAQLEAPGKTLTVDAEGNAYVYTELRNPHEADVSVLVAFDPKGAVLWRLPLRGISINSMSIASDGTLTAHANAAQTGLVLAIQTGASGPGRSLPAANPLLPTSVFASARSAPGIAHCAPDDSDADGIPDCVEVLAGLDPADTADGALDADADGLSNAAEHALGTDAFAADSDGDGMDDGFEVAHQLNAKNVLDARSDADADGRSNHREYLDGTSPNDSTSARATSALSAGAVKWRVPAAQTLLTTAAMDAADNLYYVEDSTLVSIDTDGELRWARPFASPKAKSLIVGPRGLGYVVTEDSRTTGSTRPGQLFSFDLKSGQLSPVTTPGDLSSNLVLAEDGRLYFGVGRRLYEDHDGATRLVSTEADAISALVALDSAGWLYLITNRGFASSAVAVHVDQGVSGYSFDLQQAALPAGAAISPRGTLLLGMDNFFTWGVGVDGESFFGQRIQTGAGLPYTVGPYDEVYRVSNGLKLASEATGLNQGDIFSGADEEVVSPAIATADYRLLFMTSNGLKVANAARRSGEGILWSSELAQDATPGASPLTLKLPEKGDLSAWPMLGRDGTVYAQDARGNIVAVQGDGSGALGASHWPMPARDRGRTRYLGSMLNRRAVVNDADTGNAAPTIVVASPASGSDFALGEAVVLRATAADAEDGALDAALVWRVIDENGRELYRGNGGQQSLTLPQGKYRLYASVRDSAGAMARVRRNVQVSAPSPAHLVLSSEQLSDNGDGTAMVRLTASATYNGSALDASATVWNLGNTSLLDPQSATAAGASLTVPFGYGPWFVSAQLDYQQVPNGTPATASEFLVFQVMAPLDAPTTDITVSTHGVDASGSTRYGLNATVTQGGQQSPVGATWRSNIDGALSPAADGYYRLSTGSHTITATLDPNTLPAGFSGELQQSEGVVVNGPLSSVRPLIRLNAQHIGPAGNARQYQLVATAERGGRVLDSVEFAWSSSIDGALGTGRVITAELSAGTHLISAALLGVEFPTSDTYPATGSSEVTVSAPSADVVLNLGQVNTTHYGAGAGTSGLSDFVVEFTSTGEDLWFSVTGYDINLPQEVGLQLNGALLGYLHEGGPGTANTGDLFVITAASQRPGRNYLRFFSPAGNRQWGIKRLALSAPQPLRPETDAYVQLDTTLIDELGNKWNGNNSGDQVTVGFDGAITRDLVLTVTGYDIDFADEVAIELNGKRLGHLTKGPNDRLAPTSRFELLDDDMHSAGNVIRFVNRQPDWRWGVTDLHIAYQGGPEPLPNTADVALQLDVTDTDRYGNGWDGLSHGDVVTAAFEGTANDMVLTVTGYDIDFADEVAVELNGMRIGYLAKGPNNQPTQPNTFTMAASQQLPGANLVRFVNRQPAWRWGVTDLTLRVANTDSGDGGGGGGGASPDTDIALAIGYTDTGDYGNRWQGTEVGKALTASFESTGEALTLTVTGYDIDFADEVAVELNGQPIGYLAKGPDQDLNNSDRFVIPAASQRSGANVIRFANRQDNWIWGVSDLLLEVTP